DVGGAGFEVGADIAVAERGVADDVDVLELGRLAFGDRDRDLDPVAVEVDHGGLDRDVVLAAVEVLAGQLGLHALELEAVERLALGKADTLEAGAQVLLADVLVAAQDDLGYLRALLDG